MTSFALLGSGRVARHLHFYLTQLNLTVRRWSREEIHAERRLCEIVSESSHVLFAVSDSAIESLSRPFVGGPQKLVHFSGALNVDGVIAAHPLMTFGPDLKPLDWYEQIPFVLDEGVDLAEALPGLHNSCFHLAPRLRPLYHALCSLAGNSTFLLLNRVGDEFEKSLGLPRRLIEPLLTQVVRNSREAKNFTGPVARRDWGTVHRHLDILQTNPDLLRAYRGYLGLAAAVGHTIPGELA